MIRRIITVCKARLVRAFSFLGPPKYECVIYFHGPISNWQRAIHASEVLSRTQHRFLASAISLAKTRTRHLDNVRWQIGVNGRVVMSSEGSITAVTA